MRQLRFVVAVMFAVPTSPPLLGAQSRAGGLLDSARAAVAAQHLESADALLRAALDSAVGASPAERNTAFVWQGIVRFLQGEEPLARAAFRRALAADPSLDVAGLDHVSSRLAQLFQQERDSAARRNLVYLAGHVDEAPHRLGGPPVAYPPQLLPRHVHGRVDVAAIIDTTGHVEPASFEILVTPDSGLNDPVRQMMLASQFSPGRHKGSLVRVMVQLGIEVPLPRLSATELTTTGRAALRGGHGDSAIALLAIALDTAITHPTEGEQSYALLARGVAGSRARRDSAARADITAGLALYDGLTARGVDLAPVLRRLADSLRRATVASHHAAPELAPPTAVGAVDEQPRVLSHPAIHYPPELGALGVGGTVVVAAQVDTAGHVEAASVTIVETPNHGFDAEASRVVKATRYRPAKVHGRPVRATIRQGITFAAY